MKYLKKIDAILKTQGKSRSALAREIGISRQKLAYQLKHDTFRVSELYVLCRALGCQIKYLLGD